MLRPFLQVSMSIILFSQFPDFLADQNLVVIFCVIQDVIQFGPLVKTLGLVMLNSPLLIPSIFKQVIMIFVFG